MRRQPVGMALLVGVALDGTRQQDVRAPVVWAVEPLEIGSPDDETSLVVGGREQQRVDTGASVNPDEAQK